MPQDNTEKDVSKRIGIAKGEFHIPEEFDQWDDEILNAFEEEL